MSKMRHNRTFPDRSIVSITLVQEDRQIIAVVDFQQEQRGPLQPYMRAAHAGGSDADNIV